MYIPKKANLLKSRSREPSIYRLEDLTLFIKFTIIDFSSIEKNKRLA